MMLRGYGYGFGSNPTGASPPLRAVEQVLLEVDQSVFDAARRQGTHCFLVERCGLRALLSMQRRPQHLALAVLRRTGAILDLYRPRLPHLDLQARPHHAQTTSAPVSNHP
ncbi:hypothetical protein [Lentzea sp. NPDC055074]